MRSYVAPDGAEVMVRTVRYRHFAPPALSYFFDPGSMEVLFKAPYTQQFPSLFELELSGASRPVGRQIQHGWRSRQPLPPIRPEPFAFPAGQRL